jgi:hypothetical protein
MLAEHALSRGHCASSRVRGNGGKGSGARVDGWGLVWGGMERGRSACAGGRLGGYRILARELHRLAMHVRVDQLLHHGLLVRPGGELGKDRLQVAGGKSSLQGVDVHLGEERSSLIGGKTILKQTGLQEGEELCDDARLGRGSLQIFVAVWSLHDACLGRGSLQRSNSLRLSVACRLRETGIITLREPVFVPRLPFAVLLHRQALGFLQRLLSHTLKSQ